MIIMISSDNSMKRKEKYNNYYFDESRILMKYTSLISICINIYIGVCKFKSYLYQDKNKNLKIDNHLLISNIWYFQKY